MVERLDHVGIVVDDLEGVSRAFEAILGAAPEGGAVPGAPFDVRVFRLGETDVELLRFERPLEGVDPAVFEAGGIQHLAFRVRSLDAALAALKARGVEPLRGFPRAGVHGRIAFFREPVTGQLLELVERSHPED
ncbi:MAG: methylmalonyl-CoA epimerase [Deltaproteobacteria bacterium]|nr:methylmalonyl-CoA epimerase [Deltaproteobacteria bacterium]